MIKYWQKNNRKIISVALLGVLFLFLVYFYYYGFWRHHYPVLPGDDNVRHMTEAQYISENHSFGEFISLDPPVFHILLSSLSQLSGLDIVTVANYFMPFLGILSTLTIYVVARRLLKNEYFALLASLLYVFFSPQPWQIYNDGTYLNLISAEFFLLLAVAFLPALLKKENAKKIEFILLSALFFGGVFLTHSLSAVYAGLILGTITLAAIIWKIFDKNKISLFNLLILWGIVLIVFLPFAWKFYLSTTWQTIAEKIGIFEPKNNILATLPEDLNTPADYGTYTWFLNEFLVILIPLGLLFILRDKNSRLGKMVLLVWSGIILLASRFSFFQLPHRFARDLAVPVTIIASYFIYQLIKKSPFKFVRISVATIVILLLMPAINGFIRGPVRYDGQVRVQESDIKAYQWIKNNTNENAIFVGTPLVVYAEWGSFANLFTKRQFLDGTGCQENVNHSYKCDIIYQPNSERSVKYYLENNVDYVYAGKKMLGGFIWKEFVSWNYYPALDQAVFLERVAEFPQKNLGSVVIYRVDKDKLLEQSKNI